MPKPAAETTALFEALVSSDRRFEVKKLFGHPAAFVQGNLCFGTFGTEVFFRLSEDDQHRVREIPGARPFEPMPGRAMKGYVVLPPATLADRSESRKWVERAVKFTSSLPRKKAKRKR